MIYFCNKKKQRHIAKWKFSPHSGENISSCKWEFFFAEIISPFNLTTPHLTYT